jgi:hypothetical protein
MACGKKFTRKIFVHTIQNKPLGATRCTSQPTDVLSAQTIFLKMLQRMRAGDDV